MKQPRCRIAIKIENGALVYATRCRLKPGHNGPHVGPHLAELPYQRIKWFKGDGREFQSDRDAPSAWRIRAAKETTTI